MAKQTLAVRYSGAAQVQVFRLNNGTFEAFGNPYTPSSPLTADNVALRKTCLAVQYGADFYCHHGNTNAGQPEIRKYNPATQNWDAETVPAALGLIADGVGPMIVGRGPTGAPRLVVPCYNQGSGAYLALYLDPGGSWTAGASGPGSANNQTKSIGGNWMKFRNQLHSQNARQIQYYDIETDNWTYDNVFGGGNSLHGSCFTRARGRAFCLASAVSGGNAYLNVYEFVAGNYVLSVDGGATVPTLPRLNFAGQPSVGGSPYVDAFYDDVNDLIVAFAWEDLGATANRGLKCVAIDPDTNAVTDLSGTVVPTTIRYGNLTSTTNNDARVHVQRDNESNPAAPITTIWVSFDDGSYEGFQWNGNAALMTSVGSGGDRGIALSRFDQGGGEYIYEGSSTANPAHHVEEIQGRVAIPGGTRVFVRGYTFDETGGSPVIPDETCGLWWNKAGGAGPENLGSLSAVAKVSGPGTAPTLAANKMNDMSLDGTSVYSMDWTAVSDGVANGENHQLQPRLEL